MTLIDIDPLKERIDKEVEEDKILSGWGFFFKSYLDSEPHIDIVQCKECKFREGCEQMVVFENGKYITSGYKLDYCSYGEREGE